MKDEIKYVVHQLKGIVDGTIECYETQSIDEIATDVLIEMVQDKIQEIKELRSIENDTRTL